MMNMWDTHLTIWLFLFISSSADTTLAVAAEQGLELLLVNLHHDDDDDNDNAGEIDYFFTSADFDLLLPAAKVQGCGAQTLHSELLTDGRAFTIVKMMIKIKILVFVLFLRLGVKMKKMMND